MINHEYLALVVYRETEKLTNDDPVLLFMASYIDTMSNPIDTLPAATLSWLHVIGQLRIIFLIMTV